MAWGVKRLDSRYWDISYAGKNGGAFFHSQAWVAPALDRDARIVFLYLNTLFQSIQSNCYLT